MTGFADLRIEILLINLGYFDIYVQLKFHAHSRVEHEKCSWYLMW